MGEEFKSGGQFDGGYEDSAEESAEVKEREAKVSEIETLLNPKQETSALLFNRINEQVYQGKEDPEEREKMVKKHGYDPDFLEKQGAQLEQELRKLSAQGKLSPEKAEIAEFICGLVYSSGDIRDNVSRHSSLSVGLAYELVGQMRKVVMAAAETDRDDQRQALIQEGMAPMFDFNIESFVDLTEDSKEYKKRTGEILNLINLQQKREQYRVALFILNPEKRQRPKREDAEFTPYQHPAFS